MAERVLGELPSRGTTPLNPSTGVSKRIRDEARDGLAVAAASLAGSLAVTFTLALLLRWLG